MSVCPALRVGAQRIAEEACEEPICAGAEGTCEEEECFVVGELDVGLEERWYAC